MITFFVGSDDYRKMRGAKALIDRLVPPENRDFGLEVIDAACDKAEQVLSVLDRAREALWTESFFGGGKVVWLREANFLPGTKSRATEAQAAKEAMEAFAELLQTAPLPEGHALIVSTSAFPKISKFYKWAEKSADFVDCGAADPKKGLNLSAALERLAALLPEHGKLEMAPAVRQAFVQRVGEDSWTLVSELEKLRTYLGKEGATVELRDLDAVTCKATGAEPFGLSNAICARSPAQVAKVVAQLSTEKDSAFPSAILVLNLLNELCALRDALDRGWLAGGRWTIPADQVPQRLRFLNGFILTKRLEAAGRYTLNELRAARHYAVEMRFKLVDTSSQDPWTIIEPVLLRITRRVAR